MDRELYRSKFNWAYEKRLKQAKESSRSMVATLLQKWSRDGSKRPGVVFQRTPLVIDLIDYPRPRKYATANDRLVSLSKQER